MGLLNDSLVHWVKLEGLLFSHLKPAGKACIAEEVLTNGPVDGWGLVSLALHPMSDLSSIGERGVILQLEGASALATSRTDKGNSPNMKKGFKKMDQYLQ